MGNPDFGWALDKLKAGKKVTRAGWDGKGMYLSLIRGFKSVPNNHLPFIQMCTVQGDLVPWLASQTDILADDWEVVK